MRFSSLRSRVLLLAITFALLLVGALLLTTYFVIGNAMFDVAEATARDRAESAVILLDDEARRVEREALQAGASVEEAEEAACAAVLSVPPTTFSGAHFADTSYALYDQTLELAWVTQEGGLNDHDDHREEARITGQVVDLNELAARPLNGMFGPATLGTYIVHVPYNLPCEGAAVLDVSYFPEQEERTIDSIRPYMGIIAMIATAAAILMMQLSTGWVLGLVDDLKRAADSVDADQLDVHLPDKGNNEIGDLARSINRLVDRLKRRAEAQTRFVADASHELATPVAGIRGYVNILRAWGAEDPEVRAEAVDAIDRESRRMARLCSDLLSLIRQERFTEPRSVRFDLNALVRESLASAANAYIDKGLEFVGPEEGQLFIDGDPDRIAQLLGILVDNAAKYTDQGGEVSAKTWRRLDGVFVEVSDTGVGIPAEDLPHVFDRFYRSDSSRSQRPGGFGLGLSIAKNIVEQSGGGISVVSREGEGTVFTVRLPKKGPRS
jgi:signal transduction histidine kinase